MNGLIVDTSQGLTAIYIDTVNSICDSISIQDQKLSSIFHHELDQLILKHKKSWDELDRFYYNLGPGSYTGLKVASSLAVNLAFKNISTGGFYLYEIPQLLGTAKGVWLDKAFKKEIFYYEWNGNKNHHYLIKEDDLIISENKSYFVKDISLFQYKNLLSTNDLLIKDGLNIFNALNEKPLRDSEIFYYRSINMEYQKS